ncbi:MAG: hypothetical protein GY838_11760 [bacterium]|nr:hypothetical protein [bacterium]
MRICVLLLVCLLAGAAVAQPIDTDPNGISIYFDEGARVYCTDATVGTQITAYLCLTNASDTSGFLGWEAKLESSVSNTLIGFDLRGDATNTASAPEFVVEFGTPLPFSPSTVLMEITIDVVWEWSIALRVWPAESPSGAANLPSYTTTLEPSTHTSLQYLFGWNPDEVPNWSAAINNPGCVDLPSVPAEDTSWSSVKALYR